MVALNLVNQANKRRQVPDQVSELTTNRLSVYLRCLNTLDASGVQTISSQALAEQFHLNAAQIRKDLAYFGEFGVRGVGYYVKELRRHLRQILGLDRRLRVAIMGAGNLGLALADYPGFRQEGFEIAALFDAADEKIGHESRSGVPIHDIKELRRVSRKDRLDIAVIAVPAASRPAGGRCRGGRRHQGHPELLTRHADRSIRRQAEERRSDRVAREPVVLSRARGRACVRGRVGPRRVRPAAAVARGPVGQGGDGGRGRKARDRPRGVGAGDGHDEPGGAACRSDQGRRQRRRAAGGPARRHPGGQADRRRSFRCAIRCRSAISRWT